MSAAYQRFAHAAHGFDGRPLHDIEQWDVAQPYAAPRPSDIPCDADKLGGYVHDGVQHVLFTRIAPVTAAPNCRCCAVRGAK